MATLLHVSDIENAFDDPGRIGRLVGAIQERRSDETIVCDTGDSLGPGILAMETDGEHVLPFYEAIDPELATIGNHDFDNGLESLEQVIDTASHTWLVSNLIDERTGAVFTADAGTSPWTTRQVGDFHLGFVGVTDPQTIRSHSHADPLTVTDPVTAVQETVPDVRAAADYVVVLSHAGPPDDEIATIDGVDLVLGGHVHEDGIWWEGDTPIVRPGGRGDYLSETTVTADGIEVTLHDVSTFDPAPAVIDTYESLAAQLGLATTVTHTDRPITREKVDLYPESEIGNLVADAYRWAASADVALVHDWMLRTGPPLSGEVTVLDLRSVVPFDNEIHAGTFTGDELRELLGNLSNLDVDMPGELFAHVSGVSLGWHRSPDGVHLAKAMVDGSPIDPETTYTVAAPTFEFSHKLFPPLAEDRIETTHGRQLDRLIEYVDRFGMETSLDDRMYLVEDTVSGSPYTLRT